MSYGIAVVLIVLVFGACAWRRFAREVPILTYHRIADFPGDGLSVPPDVFARQMDHLASRGYHTVSLKALHRHLTEGAPLPAKPVVLTFDDGYEDNYTNALPILKSHGMAGIVFVISNWIGKANDWEEHRPGRPSCRMMDVTQLREWLAAGLDVGCHTETHPRLSQLTDDEIRKELTNSKAGIESLLGVPIEFLCYPYGDLDERVKRLAAEASFKAAVAISSSTSVLRNDIFALRRVVISSRKRHSDFVIKISPLHVLNLALHQLASRQHRASHQQSLD